MSPDHLLDLGPLSSQSPHARVDTTKKTPEDTLNDFPSRQFLPLQCPTDCRCRCHDSAVQPLIPLFLTPYVGQFFVSKRLLHPTFSPWSRCNSQTCRGDLRGEMSVVWLLPPVALHGALESPRRRRVSFSICAPRTIPYASAVVEAIDNSDLESIRCLFLTKQASIWDTFNHGQPIFYVSWCCENA